ncbi:RNase adapter RapZ [Kerstersia sp.]|uniref:RNase adapter RapZ n=1 Tax=Kerstersia sp. TaxID=1930783 RepID=UPI003F92EB45
MNPPVQDIVIITGISGSGKSVALRMLEDSGYTCIDNLPIRYLQDFCVDLNSQPPSHAAVAIDARSPGEIEDLPEALTAIRSMGIPLRVVFLDASTEALVQRYSESRRRHPLTDRLSASGKTLTLTECIQQERELLAPLREQEHIIDTSYLSPAQLRHWIGQVVQVERLPLLLTFESFAYKIGVPSDADLVFDARCLPNPHYDAALRPLTGKDAPVAKWLEGYAQVGEMIDDIYGLVRKWLPRYMQDTRSYLTVAVGCTGGQHRSVYVVEQLALRFASHSPLLVRHRSPIHIPRA